MATEQHPANSSIDILAALRTHGRSALIAAAVAATGMLIAGIVYFVWLQPVRRASVLEFRPTFEGVVNGQYPNGLPFAPSDVAAGSVVDLVFDTNNIQEYCPREVFRSGFFVERRSAQVAFLDAEYQLRLSNPRITAVERQGLLAEYQAKRAALPVYFRLVFVKPRPCASIPPVVVNKAMTDVLTTWASESETKRGVLNHQVEVLTPAVMDVGEGIEASRLLKADLIRTALRRVIRNIDTVNAIPGAELARLGADRATFTEIQNKVTDLVRSRLEPLVVSAGQSMVRESTQWVAETVAAAEREQRAAEGRAEAYLTALREYSGTSQSAQASRAATPTAQSSDVQTISPQIDRTFIDRILEMSATNTAFRQELTQSMVEATVDAVAAQDRASYYRRLLESLRGASSSTLTTQDIDARLDDIVTQAKRLIKDFNSLTDEFSRVSLRSAAAMYQIEMPVVSEVYRAFTLQSLMMLVLGVFAVTLLLIFGYLIVRDWLRAAPAKRAM